MPANPAHRSFSSPSTPSPRDRLRRMSRWLQALVALGAIGLVGLPAWQLQTEPQELQRQMQSMASGIDITHPLLPLPWLNLLYALPLTTLGLFALWQLWHLFGAYAQGSVFGAEPTRRLRRLGWSLVLAALLGPVVDALVVLALTLNNPPGQRSLSLGVGTNDYIALLAGGLLIAVSWAMAEATRIEQDNAGFV